MNVNVVNLDASMVPLSGGEMLSVAVGATASGVTGADANARAYFWSVDGGTVRLRFDGQAPTVSTGHLVGNGASGTWSLDIVRALQVIAVSGTPVLFLSPVE